MKVFCSDFCYKASKFLKHRLLKLQCGFENKGILIFRCYRKDKVAILEKNFFAVRPLKHQTLTILVILRSQYESRFSSAHSDSSSDNEQEFVCSVLPENTPNAMGIRPQLQKIEKKILMTKKAGQKANFKQGGKNKQ